MKRRVATLTAAIGIWMMAMASIVQIAPASANSAEFHFKDKFTVNGYNGNNGPDDFEGPWYEFLDWGGSKKGRVTVTSGGDCPDSRCARITGDEESLYGLGLGRWADIEEAATATFKFKYRFDVEEATDGLLRIAAFDGSRWHVLDSLDLDQADDEAHTKSYNVIDYAGRHFAVGFFAHGEWDADVYIDNVEVFGQLDAPATSTTTTTTTTTTSAPTTTTSTTTTTAAPPATTEPPAPTTTTTGAPTPTTSTTTQPPTVTTAPPPTTTVPPAQPPTTTVPPTTTRPPTTEAPLIDDERYTLKAELAALVNDDYVMPSEPDDIPSPGPVTQIVATVTTTAVTVRSHLLSASALGLLIAAAAVFGLGRRERLGTEPVAAPNASS